MSALVRRAGLLRDRLGEGVVGFFGRWKLLGALTPLVIVALAWFLWGPKATSPALPPAPSPTVPSSPPVFPPAGPLPPPSPTPGSQVVLPPRLAPRTTPPLIEAQAMPEMQGVTPPAPLPAPPPESPSFVARGYRPPLPAPSYRPY